MLLKILKVLVVISYLFIIVDMGHIGGPLGIVLLMGFSGDSWSIALVAGCYLSLAMILLSEVSLFRKLDFYIFLLGGLILIIPIAMHTLFVIEERKKSDDTTFYITAATFLVLYGFALYKTRKRKIVNP